MHQKEEKRVNSVLSEGRDGQTKAGWVRCEDMVVKLRVHETDMVSFLGQEQVQVNSVT